MFGIGNVMVKERGRARTPSSSRTGGASAEKKAGAPETRLSEHKRIL